MHGNVVKATARRATGEAGLSGPSAVADTSSPASPSPDLPPSGPAPGLRTLRLADRDATLARATGSGDGRVQGWLVNDLSFALHTPPLLETAGLYASGCEASARGGPAQEDRVCAAVSAMCDIAPRDTLEGMLAAQMVAVHSASLDCLRRAAEAGGADRARDADLRHAARLLNVFQRQMRVRDDRRNPVLARSLTGRHAPDAAGSPPGAGVAPAREGVAPKDMVAGDAETTS